MRVTSVELHPSGSSLVIALSFRDPTRGNPYNVKEITGLDADSVISKYAGVSENSNDLFYNLSIEKRDIVMRISLNPNFSDLSYSSLRDELYRIISSSRTGSVEIQFKNETGIVAAISCRITKFGAAQFTKTPEVEITFHSDDPMLKAPNPVSEDVSGLDPSNTNIQDLVSTAPHGFAFTMTFSSDEASLIITDPTSSTWSFGIAPDGGFLTGDVLHFSSDPKAKELFIVRSGVTIYLADRINPGSVWPVIFPGDNHFACSNPTGVQWTTISYVPTFWGV